MLILLLQIFPEHDELYERYRKTLNYSKLPVTDRSSLPLTQLAVETFLTTRDRLMHVAAEQVAKDLQLTACQLQEDSLCWLYSLF